jgi:hypothetical protein
MKHVLNTFIVMIVVLPFIGCYTELATVERNDREYAYDSDTTAEDGSTIINNNYYLDDSYRQSRMRVSFNYYYPTYSSWIGSYYNSYFNDYYWGMYHRPSWYYDPFYSPYYPSFGGCLYPSPYYDPWYPFGPVVVYYPVYYPGYGNYGYGNNPPIVTADPGRPRTSGGTRDPQDDIRSRPIPGTTPAPVTATAVPTERTRVADEPVISRPAGRTPETPWWEKRDRGTRVSEGTRPNEGPKVDRGTREDERNTNAPVPNREVRPIERKKQVEPESRPAEKPRREETRSTPPQKRSVPQDNARPAERQRESSRPSYTPAPQSAPPQSAPARGGGGSSSNSGRRRD